jgi:hypothetical protein
MDKDDRIARLRGVLATDAILGREFTFCIPSIRPPSRPTRRQKPLYSAKPSQLALCRVQPFPSFQGETQAASGPQQGCLCCCIEKRLHHSLVNAGHSGRFRGPSDSQKVRRLSGSKKLRTFPFSLCEERHRSAQKR